MRNETVYTAGKAGTVKRTVTSCELVKETLKLSRFLEKELVVLAISMILSLRR